MATDASLLLILGRSPSCSWPSRWPAPIGVLYDRAAHPQLAARDLGAALAGPRGLAAADRRAGRAAAAGPRVLDGALVLLGGVPARARLHHRRRRLGAAAPPDPGADAAAAGRATCRAASSSRAARFTGRPYDVDSTAHDVDQPRLAPMSSPLPQPLLPTVVFADLEAGLWGVAWVSPSTPCWRWQLQTGDGRRLATRRSRAPARARTGRSPAQRAELSAVGAARRPGSRRRPDRFRSAVPGPRACARTPSARIDCGLGIRGCARPVVVLRL